MLKLDATEPNKHMSILLKHGYDKINFFGSKP
jgi:hypothetical protein